MIINVFNAVWFVFMGVTVATIAGITYLYRDKTRKEKLKFMRWFSIISFILWILYKYGLYVDPTFPEFNFWNELPLQPCNTMMWLAIISSFFDITIIMDYGFYVGIVAALMAILMPETGFYNIPFFSIKALGFYGTHALVLIMGVLFVTLKLTKVSYKNALRSAIFFFGMACAMFLVSFILRVTVFPEASYYFTFGNDDNFLLRAIKRFIPVNLVYLIPVIFIAYDAFLFETWAILSVKKQIRKRKKAEKAALEEETANSK